MAFLRQLIAEAREWAQGKAWAWRLALLAWAFALFFKAGAVIAMLVCLISGGWLIWQMMRPRVTPAAPG